MNLAYPLILASNSPRRKELLAQAGFNFKVMCRPVDETIHEFSDPVESAVQIAFQKMKGYADKIDENLVLCADTIVVHGGKILGKPKTPEQAGIMLRILKGNVHEVITAVVIEGPEIKVSFNEITQVVFSEIDEKDINYYIDRFRPMDKAGGYGIQEWIGLIGIKEIHGSYYNVVGLPIHRVYQELKTFAI